VKLITLISGMLLLCFSGKAAWHEAAERRWLV